MVERVGIAKGSLFQYFGSKEGLFRVIFDYAVELVRQSLRQVKKETSGADFFERIKAEHARRNPLHRASSTCVSDIS